MGYISVSAAAELLGVCVKTLHRWEGAGKLAPALRTAGGHRRYCEESLRPIPHKDAAPKHVIAYARVSSSDQRADLVRQSEVLKRHLADRADAVCVEPITDIGSGMNFQKKGLQRVLRAIAERTVAEIVVTHPDRLTRFGFGLIEQLCKLHQVKLTVLARSAEDFATQLSRDLIEIVTVFSSKLYGKRSAENRSKRNAANAEE